MRAKTFDTSKPLIAARDFTHSGVAYKRGDTLDKAKFTDRQISRLLQYRRAVLGSLATPVIVSPHEDVTFSDEPEKVETVTEPEPEKEDMTVDLKHEGGGYYKAFNSKGENVFEDTIKGRDVAMTWLKDNGYTVK